MTRHYWIGVFVVGCGAGAKSAAPSPTVADLIARCEAGTQKDCEAAFERLHVDDDASRSRIAWRICDLGGTYRCGEPGPYLPQNLERLRTRIDAICTERPAACSGFSSVLHDANPTIAMELRLRGCAKEQYEACKAVRADAPTPATAQMCRVSPRGCAMYIAVDVVSADETRRALLAHLCNAGETPACAPEAATKPESVLDAYLCERGSGEACWNAMRQASDAESQLALARRGCELRLARACRDYGEFLVKRK